MKSLYTETLSQYIDNGGNLHKDLFDKLPSYTFLDTSYNMYDLFIKRYYYCEIGQETEDLFSHYLEIKLNEVAIKYSEKIGLYFSKFKLLLDRTVKLQKHKGETITYNSALENYVNPLTTTSPKLQDMNKKTGTDKHDIIDNDEQAFSYFKSNPEIMKQAMELENIYYKALDEFKELFMQVY